jgi:hypothetical protein
LAEPVFTATAQMKITNKMIFVGLATLLVLAIALICFAIFVWPTFTFRIGNIVSGNPN